MNKKKRQLMEKMKDGYLAMAEINLALAEEGIAIDEAEFEQLEKRLAESEEN